MENIPPDWSTIKLEFDTVPLSKTAVAWVTRQPIPCRLGNNETQKRVGLLPNGSVFCQEDGPLYAYRPAKLPVLPDGEWVELVHRNGERLWLPDAYYFLMYECTFSQYNEQWALFELLGDGLALDPFTQTAEFESQESAGCFNRAFPDYFASYKIPSLYHELLDGLECSPEHFRVRFASRESAVVFARRHPHWLVEYTQVESIRPQLAPEDGRRHEQLRAGREVTWE